MNEKCSTTSKNESEKDRENKSIQIEVFFEESCGKLSFLITFQQEKGAKTENTKNLLKFVGVNLFKTIMAYGSRRIFG